MKEGDIFSMANIPPYPLPDDITQLFDAPVQSTADQIKQLEQLSKNGEISKNEAQGYIQAVKGYEKLYEEG